LGFDRSPFLGLLHIWKYFLARYDIAWFQDADRSTKYSALVSDFSIVD